MTTLDRRRFVQGSATIFALSACASIPKPRVRSPNEEIRVGVIGLRGRGRALIDGLRALPNVRVVALCDVDLAVLAREVARFEGRDESVVAHQDLRELIERQDVDVIATATPNHWHALIAVWSCQAGKDVYLEKPVSHNIWEGRQIVKAARRYGRIVQTGTQSRSSRAIAEGIEFVRAGNLGRIVLARGLCYKPRQSIGKVPGPQPIPSSLDYDLWCGPAPRGPLLRKNLHYDWHWDFATGNGDLGNQGIHQMDICRWALGESRLAPRVLSIGGRFGYDDDGNTPNTQMVFLDYPDAPLLFEVRGLPRDLAAQSEDWNGSMDSYQGARIGVIVHCERGSLRIPNYTSAVALDEAGEEIQSWKGADDHFANFIDCVRSRRVEDLNADIEEGHVSSALCHMGNVSHHMGRTLPPEQALERLRATPAAAETFERMRAHLAANAVDLGRTPFTVGPWLAFDPSREVFEEPGANRWLARSYRDSFRVPARV